MCLKCLFSRASEAVFYEKVVIEGFLADSHHCQASIVGKSESYNELFRRSKSTEFCQKFVNKNKSHYVTFTEEEEHDGDDNDDLLDENSCKEFKKTFFWESSRKSLAAAIWLKVAIEEALDRNMLNVEFFGPKIDASGKRVTFVTSLNDFMERINELR